MNTMVAMSSVIELSARIAEESDPEKIILFGSYAYGTPREYSDVDLLVLMDFEGHPFDKATEILERVDHSFYVDAIVRRPGDAARRYREHDPLIREAFDRGRVLYCPRRLRNGFARPKGITGLPHGNSRWRMRLLSTPFASTRISASRG